MLRRSSLLDACEHALTDAARVASAVLPECPDVRVLATSREVLHHAGEVPITLKPLSAPDAAATDGADSPAVQLFAARARTARPGFELTAATTPLAAEIARRVDGLPLAIELAAARINVLGLAELSSLVEHRLALLRDRPPSDPIRTALQGARGVELRAPAPRREDTAAPARGAPRRRLALLAARCRRERRARRGDGQPPARRARRQVDHLGLLPGRRSALRRARHGPRLRARAPGRERRPRRRSEGACGVLRHPGRSGAGRATRAGVVELGAGVSSSTTTTSGPPSPTRARRPTQTSRSRLAGRWACTSCSPSASPRAASTSSSRSRLPRTKRRSTCESSSWAWLCFFALEELDLDAAIEAGERAVALSAGRALDGSNPPWRG